MNRKTISFLLAAVMCLSLCACSGRTAHIGGDATVTDDNEQMDFSNYVTVVSSPTPVITEETPEPAASPSPTPTAAPFSSPSPTPAVQVVPAPGVVITKNPTSEKVDEGGSATFIANASGYSRVSWILYDEYAKKTYTMESAVEKFDGLKVKGQNSTTLVLSDIPYEIDGFRVQAVFDGSYYTSGAHITVVESSADPAERKALSRAKSDLAAVKAAGYTSGGITDWVWDGADATFNVTYTSKNNIVIFSCSGDEGGFIPTHVSVYTSDWENIRSEDYSGSMASIDDVLKSLV